MQTDLFGSTSAPLHRLFFALVPTQDEQATLAEIVAALRPRIPRARWVQPSRYHVTLDYLGESAGRRDDWIMAALRSVEGWMPTPCDVTLDHLRALGNPRRPALALTASAIPPGLQAFSDQLRERTRRAGFRAEQGRGFLPHLTVAYTEPAPPLPEVAPFSLRLSAWRLVLSIADADAHVCLREWRLPEA